MYLMTIAVKEALREVNRGFWDLALLVLRRGNTKPLSFCACGRTNSAKKLGTKEMA